MTPVRPTFSVIIPAYQRADHLERCLEALVTVCAGRDDCEVIVVDDGSAVPLEDAVLAFSGRLPVRYLQQANAGPGAARNTGAAQARGEYLVFTDDDCLPTPGWLTALYGELAAEPHRLVGGPLRNALTDNPYSAASAAIVELAYAYYNRDWRHARFLATNNLAVPADTFRILGGFDQRFRTAEDRDLCDRWRAAGYPLVYAPDAVVLHAHTLTLRRFWRQHVGYGRGAYRFYRAHAQRTAGESTLDASFYFEVLQTLPRLLAGQPFGRAVGLLALLVVWQAANTTGFVSEALQVALAARVPQRRARVASR